MTKLPKIKRAKLPRARVGKRARKKLPRRVGKSLPGPTYRYMQMEPLFKPFYMRLRKVFDRQRIDFKKSGILPQVMRKKRGVSKSYIKTKIKKVLDDDMLVSSLKSSYLKQQNLLQGIFQDEKTKALTKAQQAKLLATAKKINNHTADRITNTLYKAYNKKYRLSKAKVEMHHLFRDMADYRSDRIGKTELTIAQNDYMLKSLKSLGLTRKKWVLCGVCSGTGSCPVCKANAAEGWVSINNNFPSGHFTPPAHPNCTCGIR